MWQWGDDRVNIIDLYIITTTTTTAMNNLLEVIYPELQWVKKTDSRVSVNSIPCGMYNDHQVWICKALSRVNDSYNNKHDKWMLLGDKGGGTKYHLSTSFTIVGLVSFSFFLHFICHHTHKYARPTSHDSKRQGEQQKRTLCLSSVTGQPLISLPSSYPQS